MTMKAMLAVLCVTVATGAQADGDIKAGKKVFKKCKACHTLKEGDSRVGPTLYKIVGAASGAQEGFNYSSAMKEAELIWDEETLAAFLTKPKDVVPRTTMSFAGLKKPQDVVDLVAYLKSETEAE